MECNKEEAIRAKEIAENKMQSNDFAVARKFALKAQRLYQDLENVSQMITVCDVHCSAEKKLFGNEMDWYGLLQIEQTANEATIKKQYRKFALQLHPDKNKFPGAETAFKLIGDAHRVLLDKDKRSLHDMKCKASVRRPTAPYQPPQKPTYPNVGTQNDFRSTFTGSNFHHQRPQQPAQPGISNGGPTFWTMCPFCTVKYQYYRKVINKYILCQTCNKPFVAYERGEQSIPMATNLAQPAFHQQKVVPSQPACKFEQVFKGNFAPDNSKATCPQKTRCSSDFGKEKVNGKRGRKQVVESSESCSSESSSDSEVDVAIDENSDIQGGENFGHNADQNPRRSRRHKKQVFYKENLSDDNDDNDFMSHPKRFKGRGSSCATGKENGDASREEVPKFDRQSGSAAAVKEEQIEAKQKYSSHFGERLSNVKNDAEKASGEKKVEENGCGNRSGVHADGDKTSSEAIADSTLDSSSETAENPEFYVYPDPDFNDFDKGRKEECFKVGQMWAIYDTVDAMPRFYALIRNVFTSGFKVRITWLEPDPDDVKAKKWVNKGLPFSCGRFMRGNSDITEDRLMFSHLVGYQIGIRGDTYNIYPLMGEVWGLFKSWDFNWISDADTNRKYDYEFVEILSDYTKSVGITVAYLAKVKGFASVFYRKSREGTELVQIPPAELFRFSHRVPSFKLTGEEREDVLKGSFELDPASLPLNLEEISVPEILKNEAGGVHSNCSLGSFDREKSRFGYEGCTSMHQDKVKETCLEPEGDRSYEDIEHQCAPPASTPEAIEIPDPEFFNDFDKGRKEECFKVGQMWAIYDTVDAMPRFYALIRNVFTSGFKVRITWLEPDPDDVKAKKWVNKGLPFSCGRFMLGNSVITEDRLMFSHLVGYEIGIRGDTYNIYPMMGEVWGLFKSWDFNWISDADRKYDYEFVEILSEYTKGVGITVAYLAKVKGFASVFYRKSREGTELVQIPPAELFRFSHSVPSFKLTGEEREDVLKGSFELDPASLPLNLEEISVPEILKNEAGGVHSYCSLGSFDREKSQFGSEGCTSMHQDKVKETCLEPEGDRSYEDIEHQCVPPASTPEAIEIPDPELFNDFDKGRKEECFKVGQMWAIYDTVNAMPRFYALIRNVFTSGFKLRITWLEPDPDDVKAKKWVNKGLPFSCGRFMHGNSDITEDRLMFSHLVCYDIGIHRDTYNIYPRMGEVWGLFKSWDFNWISDANTNRKYDYEFVEILSDYTKSVGITVAYLAKVKGFASVFYRKSREGTELVQIPPSELFRFSHSVPSFKLTGEERDDVLKGSFELDPASLPLNLEEISVPEILKNEAGGVHSNCSLGSFDKEKSRVGSEGCTSMHPDKVKETCLEPEGDRSYEDIEHQCAPPASTPEAIEIPDPEFFNFAAERSENKLQVGQIWSLYSVEDGLPKRYGQIVKIQPDPEFKLYLRWLESCLLPNNTIWWHDEGMPICCGRFKIKKGKLEEYPNTVSFSHLVSAEPASNKNEFTILPRYGEIWALYKNWDAGMKSSNLENCEYDIVEIIEAHNLHIEVLLLKLVAGFNSVFKPRKEASAVMKISLEEMLRFSHQIPAFKLTEERDSSLRGCWELDPAALPVQFFLLHAK